MRCPCRKKSETTSYDACCGRYHCGSADAPTADALLRSRYTAFVRQDADYLLRTWHASTRGVRVDFTPDQQWLLLRILQSKSEGDTAIIEFVARSRIAGRSHVLHEVSRFVREDGCWFYVDGDLDQSAES